MGKYDIYTFFDKSVPFKKFHIKPVRIKDYVEFFAVSDVIVQDIYSLPDPHIISMKYLDYLIEMNTEENSFMGKLAYLLMLVIEEDISPSSFSHVILDEKNYLVIDGEFIDGKDFEELRIIISEQNGIEIPNHLIDRRIRVAQAEARAIRAKMDGAKPATLEDYILSVVASTGIPVDSVYDMTIRKFNKLIQRIDHMKHYEIFLSASMSGFVKFKNKNAVTHWLSSLEKDEFENTMSYDELEAKVT